MNALRTIKDVALKAVQHTSAYKFIPRGWAATIFMLHRVVDDDCALLNRPVAISRKFLDAVVGQVVRKGFAVVTLDEMHRRLAIGSFDPPMIVFTFDDGYRDNLKNAAPVFQAYKVPWTLYLTTGFPDRDCGYWWGLLEAALLQKDRIDIELPGLKKSFSTRSLHEKRLAYLEISRHGGSDPDRLAGYIQTRYGLTPGEVLDEHALTWEEIRMLKASGLVEIAGHTMTHPVLSQLDPDRARREIEGCRARIRETIGVEIEHFAFPFGDPSSAGPREHALAQAAGYKTATTTVPCNIYPSAQNDLHFLPRLGLDGMDQHLSQLGLHLSGATGLFALRSKHPLFMRRVEASKHMQSLGASGLRDR